MDLNKLHNTTKHMVFSVPLINHAINAKWLGSTVGAISYYYDLIVKGVSPLTRSLLKPIQGHGHHASSYRYIQF